MAIFFIRKYAGTKELKHFFWKKENSFQQLEKKEDFWILLCCFFYVVYPFLVTVNLVIIAVLLFTRTIKVADVIYYGYLFHIVFH